MKKFGTYLSCIAVTVWTGMAVMPLNAQDQNASSQSSSTQTTNESSGTSQQQNTPKLRQASKASDLMGKTVQSKNGEKLGTINDLIIDKQTGRLDFAIISTGGLAGVGSVSKVVPPAALSTATAKRGILSLDVNSDDWKKAPNFNKDQLSSLSNPTQAQQIYQYYHQTWPAMASQSPGASQPLSPTGRNVGGSGQLSLASDLIGKRVVNSQNQDMGKISDLLVELNNPKTTFAVLKPGSFITDANKQAANELFAIPANAFRPSPDSNKMVLDIDPGQFQQAPALSESSWMMASAAGGSPQIFRYDPNASTTGTAPDNTRLNARDRQPGAVTPTDQSESKDDLRLTQSIRQAIVKDDSLSTMAKNVKIITANGKVTLRGPVHTEQERSEIERLAQQVAGTATVQNEIEVKGN